MRVIAGENRGAILKTVPSRKTRPTLGRVKEALFNILANKIADAEVLDLFAGSGSLGIEALSRGAKNVVFIDNNPKCIRIVRENLNKFGLNLRGSVYVKDAYKAINYFAGKNKKFDVLLIDPPYNTGELEKIINNPCLKDILSNSAVLVAEHSKKNTLPSSDIKELCHVKSRRYGDTVLTFYEFKQTGSSEN